LLLESNQVAFSNGDRVLRQLMHQSFLFVLFLHPGKYIGLTIIFKTQGALKVNIIISLGGTFKEVSLNILSLKIFFFKPH
jgi:hypothetical protein